MAPEILLRPHSEPACPCCPCAVCPTPSPLLTASACPPPSNSSSREPVSAFAPRCPCILGHASGSLGLPVWQLPSGASQASVQVESGTRSSLFFSHTLSPPPTCLHGVLSLSPPPLTSQRQSPAPSITRSLHRSPCLPWMELALLFRMRGHLLSSTLGFYLNSELAEKKLVLLLQITSQ